MKKGMASSLLFLNLLLLLGLFLLFISLSPPTQLSFLSFS